MEQPESYFPPPIQVSPVAIIDQQVSEIVREREERDREALRLYEPLATQEAFHRCTAPEVIIIGSNRSGKTTAGLVEVARAVTGQDPSGKYPLKNGRCVMVAKDQKHIAEVFYDKLFKGSFKIIRDLQTGNWRALRRPDDDARENEAIMVPLIPERYVADVSWEDKKQGVPKKVVLTTGWEITFYTANSSPPQGVALDLCLAGWSEVYDPVAGRLRRIDTIAGPWHVRSFNEHTGKYEVRRASRPFIKGMGEICRVELSNGEVLYTTRRHRVLCEDGEWRSIQQAFDLRERIVSSPHHDATIQLRDSGVHAEPTLEMPEQHEQSQQSLGANKGPKAARQSCSAVCEPTTALNCDGEYAPTETQTTEGCLGDYWSYCHQCDELALHHVGDDQGHLPLQDNALGHDLYLLLDAQGIAPTRSHSDPHSDKGYWSECDQFASRSVSFERQSHEGFDQQAASLFQVRSKSQLPSSIGRCTSDESHHRQLGDDCIACHKECDAQFRLPPASDGQPCSEFDSDAISTEATSSRLNKAASGRQRQAIHESEFSSPHFISITPVCAGPIWDISVPGTHNYVYAGTVSHNCCFDEEIDNRLFYSECAARLGDRRGRFIWMATPQTGTDELFQLHERAMACAQDEKPAIVEFHLSISDNRFFHKDEIAKLIEKYKNNPEEYKVRILGEFNHTSYLVYPEFSMDRMAHGCKVFDIPDEWNRWMVVDPGATVCAVLFFAVPPYGHELSDQRFLYDELYLTNCSAEKLGAHVAEKAQGKYFTGFLIDPSSVKQDRIGGAGDNVFVQYGNALRNKGVESRQSGSSFLMANNDKRAGLLKVQSWLYHRPDTGRPILQVFEDRCPNFEREMRYYRRKRRPDGTILDEPVDRNDHACDALRYYVMHDPRWEKQPAFKKKSFILEYWKKHQRDRDKESGNSHSINFGTRVA